MHIIVNTVFNRVHKQLCVFPGHSNELGLLAAHIKKRVGIDPGYQQDDGGYDYVGCQAFEQSTVSLVRAKVSGARKPKRFSSYLRISIGATSGSADDTSAADFGRVA